jgi:hypothetical protein
MRICLDDIKVWPATSSPAPQPWRTRRMCVSRYMGRIDLQTLDGDLDYHSFSGHFIIRVTSRADDFSEVNLMIAGGDAWRDFSIRVDTPIVSSHLVASGDWLHAMVAACRKWPRK